MSLDEIPQEKPKNKGGRPKAVVPDDPALPLENARHEVFAQCVAEGRSYTQAYVMAGFSEKSANSSAGRLVASNAGISARIAHLKERNAVFFNVSRERLIYEHQRTAAQALESRQASARTGALKEVSILSGHREVDGSGLTYQQDVRKMTPFELGSSMVATCQKELEKAMKLPAGEARDQQVNELLTLMKAGSQMVQGGPNGRVLRQIEGPRLDPQRDDA